MIDYILKYKTGNLIIIYCYVYSRLLDIVEDIIQNSMELTRNARFSFQIDG